MWALQRYNVDVYLLHFRDGKIAAKTASARVQTYNELYVPVSSRMETNQMLFSVLGHAERVCPELVAMSREWP